MVMIRRIWRKLFPESIEKDMATAMINTFAAQAKGF
jgi:hypothetical protein